MENGIISTLKQKVGGLPIWAWSAMGIIALALWLQRRNQKKGPATDKSAQNAANQTNSNLGSASQLDNLFNVAGLMPYSGGITYENNTTPAPEQTITVNVGKNQTVGELVDELHKNGYPGFTWADFWALNPDIVGKSGLQWTGPGKDWKFTQWTTPVVVYKPGTKMGLPVSGNAPGTQV